ncbi:MAG: hypothetical protein KJ697_04120 [Nanoarchaeota archaeon]|nr:hypothetical protein [Nanoarchaeota archaeon]
MNKIDKQIFHFTNLGFGNIEIKRKLGVKGINLSTSTIYRRANKFKKKFYDLHVLENFNDILDKDCILVSGSIYSRFYKSESKVRSLEFSCLPLRKLLLKKEIRVVPYFSSDYTKVMLIPNKMSKSKLIPRKYTTGITVSFNRFFEDGNKLKPKIDIYIPLKKFGIKDTDTIVDNDARILFPALKEFGWKLCEKRVTDSNNLADLFVQTKKRKYIIEITSEGKKRKKSAKLNMMLRYRIAAKSFFISTTSKRINATPIIILWNGLKENGVLNREFFNGCELLNIKLLFTDFNENWQFAVAKQLAEIDTNEQIL